MGTFVQPASIKAIAETVDVTGLSEEAAKALAPDVEYRLREVIQASASCEDSNYELPVLQGSLTRH